MLRKALSHGNLDDRCVCIDGKKLKTIRYQKLLTQAQLVERSDVSMGTIGACERKYTRKVSLNVVKLLAEALEIDPKELYTAFWNQT